MVYGGFMAIVFAENTLEIAVRHLYAGKPSVNVWHMHFSAELSFDTMTELVNDFRNNWQDHMMDDVVNTVVLQDFAWRSLDPGNGSNGIVLPDPAKPTTGGVAAAGFPPNVAVLVHKNTANRPRGRRDGRAYIAGLAEQGAGDGGELESSVVSIWNTLLTSFYNGISDSTTVAGGDRYPVVLETTEASRAPGTGSVTIGTRRVTSLTVDPVLATQRDRLR